VVFYLHNRYKKYAMKKIILAGFLFLVVKITVGQYTEYGLKAGVNLASFKIGSNTTTDSRTGFHVGGLAHIHLAPPIAFQPEIVFSSQGADHGNGTKDKVNYINVPLLAQLMLGQGFRLETGPQVGFLVSAQSKNGHSETSMRNNFKKTDFSWSFGAGFLTTSRLGLDVRYNLGISNISTINPEIQNRVWQLGLFYQCNR
jgi:hypothetical protein